MILASAPDSEFAWFTAHAGHYSAIILAVLSVLLIVTRVIEGSEKLARYIPLIGKKLRERGRRREEATAERVTEKVMEKLEPANYVDRVERLERRIDILERKDDVAHDYRCYDAEWHRRDEMKRAEDGWPIIEHLTWDEFAAKWHTGLRYENGKWFTP